MHEKLSCRLLQGDAKTSAGREAGKLKRCIQSLRYLFRNSEKSVDPQVTELKSLLRKSPRSAENAAPAAAAAAEPTESSSESDGSSDEASDEASSEVNDAVIAAPAGAGHGDGSAGLSPGDEVPALQDEASHDGSDDESDGSPCGVADHPANGDASAESSEDDSDDKASQDGSDDEEMGDCDTGAGRADGLIERPPIDPPAVAKGLLDLPTAHPLLPPGKTRSPPPDAPPAGSVPPRDMYGRPVDSSKFVDAGPVAAWDNRLVALREDYESYSSDSEEESEWVADDPLDSDYEAPAHTPCSTRCSSPCSLPDPRIQMQICRMLPRSSWVTTWLRRANPSATFVL